MINIIRNAFLVFENAKNGEKPEAARELLARVNASVVAQEPAFDEHQVLVEVCEFDWEGRWERRLEQVKTQEEFDALEDLFDRDHRTLYNAANLAADIDTDLETEIIGLLDQVRLFKISYLVGEGPIEWT